MSPNIHVLEIDKSPIVASYLTRTFTIPIELPIPADPQGQRIYALCQRHPPDAFRNDAVPIDPQSSRRPPGPGRSGPRHTRHADLHRRLRGAIVNHPPGTSFRQQHRHVHAAADDPRTNPRLAPRRLAGPGSAGRNTVLSCAGRTAAHPRLAVHRPSVCPTTRRAR